MKALDPCRVDLEKTTLIEASAGTGKTYTIATLFCRLVAKGLPVESILVVTFTEAAAAELKLRIRQRLSDTLDDLENAQDGSTTRDELIELFRQNDPSTICKRLELAITCFDQASILTIHSFCLKVLKDNAFESKALFDIQLMPERSLFLYQVCYDFFMTKVNVLDPLLLNYLETKNITPESFMQAFNAIVSRKRVAIVPESQKMNLDVNAYRQTVQRIKTVLEKQQDQIKTLLTDHNGIDKRSYSKRYLSSWLETSYRKIVDQGPNTFFVMTEKGDALFKFCTSRIVDKTKTGQIPPRHEFFDLCQKLTDMQDAFENHLISLKHEFINYFNAALETIKQTQGICFFDDLVNDLYFALTSVNARNLIDEVRKTYTACLIDEFQDTDPIQYEIFSKIFSRDNTPFFMIGDPKQAIYAFRGGDIFAYLKASSNSSQQFTLTKNYRSAPLLVQGVNQIFSFAQNPFLYEKIAFMPVSTPDTSFDRLVQKDRPISPVRFLFVSRENTDTDKNGFMTQKTAQQIIEDLTAKDIVSLLDSDFKIKRSQDHDGNAITPKDIAVLVRTNAQAQKINTALSALNIPSYVSKSGSVYESRQAIDLYDILTAVLHPENFGYIKAALCTGVFNYSAQQLYDLDLLPEEYTAWQERFYAYKMLWDQKGFVSMIMAVFHSDHAFLNSNGRTDERNLTNYYHLVELISQACVAKELTPEHLIKWYARQFSTAFRDESADELRLDSDKDAVAIVTIHKSKGLEYPVVYLPYIWEGQRKANRENILYHDPENDHGLTLDLGSDKIDTAISFSDKETQAEQRRLLYVALTRASAMCKIIWAGIKNVETSPLAQILHPNGCKDDTTMLSDLNALEAKSLNTILIETPPLNEEEKLSKIDVPSRFEPKSLAAQPVLRDIFAQWKMSSFSNLLKTSHAHTANDHDSVIDNNNLPKITLENFPKGPRAGDCFHLIFESIDFTPPPDDNKEKIMSILYQFGYTDPDHVQQGINAVRDILATRLDTKKHHFRLKDIDSPSRLNEMEFVFPVDKFNIQLIQNAFEISSPDFKNSGYLNVLSQMHIADFKGYLKGFVDLIFCHQGKWYILDYKSNFLGDTYDKYSQKNMQTAMAEHHYFLQYYIYLVALHRYLKSRVKDYDYETHFGGVFYLFIRGMHPDHLSEYGVFYDKPSKHAIYLLSDNL